MASVTFANDEVEFTASLRQSTELIIVAPCAMLRNGAALGLLRSYGGAVAQALSGPEASAMAADASTASAISGSCVSSYISTSSQLAKLVSISCRARLYSVYCRPPMAPTSYTHCYSCSYTEYRSVRADVMPS